MFFEGRAQFVGLCRFCHLRQCLQNLLFGEVDVF